MTISSCSSCSSTSPLQSQAQKNQTDNTEAVKQEHPQDTVQISAQALNQLKGTDPDGDGH